MAWAGAAVIACGAGWLYYQEVAGISGEAPTADIEPTFIEDAMSQVSNIATSVADKLAEPQVLAFLALIRTGEGTTGPNGYRTMFGGGLFTSFADHPRTKVTRSGYTSSAAGAYQFLPTTWDEMASKYGLRDFSPASQEIAAVGLIKRRGALADVLAGRFRAAIDKCNKEWASLPGSPYGQPTLTYTRAQNILAANGASIVGRIA
ncbi:glycoside hydrolase family 104 protein [Massilia sp. P8910]|uniref:glycoside hydrolase family 24 protein n=1 Tax=Massilia antarctica TaxID=2765360 RepID=UPI001E376513|nr:glycoside hydrolase family 104 protein [Massilia antarctica]MCE3602380.1 glycoside hydrolase family 104 protein [Massilia antarctica]